MAQIIKFKKEKEDFADYVSELNTLCQSDLASINTVILNNDGRADQPLVEGNDFKEGQYELIFFIKDYFKNITSLPKVPFLNEVVVRFGISNSKEHYHVPLLVSPWSYSTYRGS